MRAIKTFVVVSFFAICLALSSSKGSAQMMTGGHWAQTYKMYTGFFHATLNTGPVVDYGWGVNDPSIIEPVAGGSSTTVNYSGSCTLTYEWVDDFGFPALNPPSSVIIKESASAGWTCDVPDATVGGSGSNGLQDPYVSGYDISLGGNYGRSKGSHLHKMDGSSGSITN